MSGEVTEEMKAVDTMEDDPEFEDLMDDLD